MSIPLRREANPLFGKTTLSAVNNGIADWIRGSTSPLDQKGSTGWLARLYGGVQTGDDWARVNIPVDEIFVSDFHAADWSWYQTDTQTMGLGIVIWVHDPNDFDNRAEITQLGGHGDLPKTPGWNAFSFSPDTEGMFFYGEGTTGTDLTAGTQYAWSAFQADKLFSKWTIYRITLDWGWEASGTFNYVYVADVKLNGVAVQLRPNDPLVDSDGHAQVDVLTITAGANVLGKVRLVDSGGTEVTEATGHSVQAKLIAGAALAGKFGIDQVTASANEVVVKSITAGDTNIGNVDIASAIPAGTNLMGKVGIDQTTPGTTNLVATSVVKTIQTELKAITEVAADVQSASSELALTGIKKATIFIDHAKDNASASVGQGTEYVVQVSEKATGNDTWRALASFTAAITVPTAMITDAEEAAGQTVIECGAALPAVGDILFFKNATIANSEWANVIARVTTGGSETVTLGSGLTNTQAQGTYYTQGEHFVLTLDVEALTRLRVVCNNTKGTTNRAIVWRCAAITVV